MSRTCKPRKIGLVSFHSSLVVLGDFVVCCVRGAGRTFFITLTASSVCPTNSSSACSTIARASSLMTSSSSPSFLPACCPGSVKAGPPFALAFVASKLSRAFSTALRARCANIKFVFSVVLQPARKRLWICASWARRASPTFSLAMAYFSSAVVSGSSPAPAWSADRMCELFSAARAMAWLNVLGCGFAAGGAVSAAWASAGEVADDSRCTFSDTVRPRSLKDSRILVG